MAASKQSYTHVHIAILPVWDLLRLPHLFWDWHAFWKMYISGKTPENYTSWNKLVCIETCLTNVNIAAFSLMYTRLQRLRACTCQTVASFLIVKHISFGGCPGMLHTPLLAVAKLGVFYQGSPALGGAGLTSCPDRSHH